jgi:uncharacterized protein YkwD
MRQSPIFALTAAIALTTVLVFVVGADPVPAPEPQFESDPVAQVLGAEVGATTTTMDLDFSDETAEPQVLSEVEVDLTADVDIRSTTTTTTTLPAHAHPPAAPKKSNTSKPKTTAPTSTTTTTQPPSTGKAEFRSNYESEFQSQINSFRASSGLPALARNGSLDAWARDWAKTMAESGSIMHSNIASLLPPWSAAAENVGKGGSVSTIFGLLKESSPHVSNMVGNYTDVGIGVWQDSGGTLWTVHVFTR